MVKRRFQYRGSSRSSTFESRTPKYYYLIVCEGEKTEPNYFKSLKEDLPKGIVDVDILGEGFNTLSIIQEAKDALAKSKTTFRPYDKVWVVFDRDSFPASDFDNAIHSAEAAGFGCAWSNEAFELWYILHFEYRNTGMSRDEYKKRLSTHLGGKYKKNDPDMYRKLVDKQCIAIRHSARLEKESKGITPSKANPATTVHLLVIELNEYKTQKVK